MVAAMEDGPPYQGHFWLPQLRPTLVESLQPVATLKEGSLLLLPWQQQLMSLVVEAAVKNVKNFPFPKEVIINEKFFREG